MHEWIIIYLQRTVITKCYTPPLQYIAFGGRDWCLSSGVGTLPVAGIWAAEQWHYLNNWLFYLLAAVSASNINK